MNLAILGATGVVGKCVLQSALNHSSITRVVAPTRKPLLDSILKHEKIVNPVHSDVKTLCESLVVDATICTLGTTIKTAGSKARFRDIDQQLVIDCAQTLHVNGCQSFAYVSSIGAKPGKNFYLNCKYETEQALKSIGFQSISIIRPSLINALREDSRPVEKASIYIGSVISPLIPRMYKPVKPESIAQGLIQSVISSTQGIHIIESAKL